MTTTTNNNTNSYRYRLDSRHVTNRRQQKTTCPQCGRKKCFVRYVDTFDHCAYVDDTCGRCDHEQSCGYHLTPRQYLAQHPRQQQTGHPAVQQSATPPAERPLEPLSMDYVRRSHSQASVFWQWVRTSVAPRLAIDEATLRSVFNDYWIGATLRGEVIFWQIDCQQRVRSGHIITYQPDGHRTERQSWAHYRLQKRHLLPQDWTLHQCLFGEHLLPRRPNDSVCLVESEKTAVVMAALQPHLLWLATAGSNGLTPQRLACLQGRRVTLFPDSGCYQKWSQQMLLTPAIDYNVSPRLESYPPNSDLCDLLLGPLGTPQQPPESTSGKYSIKT